MADQTELTDSELLAVANAGDSSLLRKLSPDERARLDALRGGKEQPGTSAALAMAVPRVVKAGAEALATSPTAAKTLGAAARSLTTAGAVVHGVYSGSPTQVLAAPMEGWAAGKGGYFLGKGLQSAAAPVASALDKLSPVMRAINPLTQAQGVNDLAQMAEPNRQDIGFLGIGQSVPSDPNHPALLNLIASRIAHLLRNGQ